jgi:hypothetical protein
MVAHAVRVGRSDMETKFAWLIDAGSKFRKTFQAFEHVVALVDAEHFGVPLALKTSDAYVDMPESIEKRKNVLIGKTHQAD